MLDIALVYLGSCGTSPHSTNPIFRQILYWCSVYNNLPAEGSGFRQHKHSFFFKRSINYGNSIMLEHAVESTMVKKSSRPVEEEGVLETSHVEKPIDSANDLVCNDVGNEPELHARTYIALVAMFLLNMVQLFALQGPPAVVSNLHPIELETTKLIGPNTALVHRCGSQEFGNGDMGTQFALSCTGSDLTSHLLRVRRIPGAKDTACWNLCHLVHWRSNCARLRQHLSTDFCSNLDWVRFRLGTSCILCSK